MSGMELMARVEALSARLDAAGDPLADEAVGALMDLYGAGLERICSLVDPAVLARDKFVSSLLLIHDLHPVSLEDRVRGALEKVRPYMESHGGDVELLGLEDGVARLRLVGSCTTCAASTSTLELAVEKALEEACPDLEGMEVEGLAPPVGVPLPMAGSLPMAGAPAWFDADGVAGLALDAMTAAQVAGRDLVVANVDGTLLAYRNACAACGGALDGGELTGGVLACPGCGRMFVLPRAGRSADDERLQLEPIPLLREQGRVRVALAG
jgi:Fe-S cluster biogenesis protein NfuA/nitrite reductase/ring-hydroxylating ferredoxin subunit